MDTAKIKMLIDLMIESDLHRLAITQADQSVILTRRQAAVTVMPTVAEAPQQINKTATLERIEKAPMLGTFYAASAPLEPCLAKIGQVITVGDTLGIIEAMKIMNPIEATQSGVVAEILVKNGDIVQFNQPLFRLRDA